MCYMFHVCVPRLCPAPASYAPVRRGCRAVLVTPGHNIDVYIHTIYIYIYIYAYIYISLYMYLCMITVVARVICMITDPISYDLCLHLLHLMILSNHPHPATDTSDMTHRYQWHR